MRPVLLLVLCAAGFAPAAPAGASEWGQWLGPKRDAVWDEKGLLTQFPKDGPKVVWRQPIAAGYAGPAVVGGKLYVMDREATKIDPANPPAKGTLPGNERVLCLNAADGKTLWTHTYDCPYVKVSYPSGPRTTPVIDGDRLFTLGTMGDLLCLNAADGKVVWSKNFVKDLAPRCRRGAGRRTSCSTATRWSRWSAATGRRWSRSTRRPVKRSGKPSRRRRFATRRRS
jgi:outer membrane protein assembly factor BamB